MVFRNKDVLDQYDCEIASYAREKAKLSNRIEETERKKIEYGFSYYNNKEKRKDIISLAEQYGFSDKKIRFMNEYVDNWNQDVVTMKVIDTFHMAEKFVEDNKESHNPFYRLSNWLLGGNDNDF